jgi:hypothetical protein
LSPEVRKGVREVNVTLPRSSGDRALGRAHRLQWRDRMKRKIKKLELSRETLKAATGGITWIIIETTYCTNLTECCPTQCGNQCFNRSFQNTMCAF